MDLDSSFLTFSPKPKNKLIAYKKITKMSLKHQEHLSPQRTNILQDSVNSLKHDNYECNKFSTKTTLNIDKDNQKKVDSSSRNTSKLMKSKIIIDKENYEMKSKNKLWNNVHIKKSLVNNSDVLKTSLNISSEIFNDDQVNDRCSIDNICKSTSYRDSCSSSNNSSQSDIFVSDSSSSPSPTLLVNDNGSSPDIILVSDSSPSPPPKAYVNKTIIVESESECEEAESKNVGVSNRLRKSDVAIKKKGISPHCNTTSEFNISQTEDILNKLYGNDWDKEKVLPKSTPQLKFKGFHADSFRRKGGHNHSSSSEDNFEEFTKKRKELAESIRRKALTPLNTDENFLTDGSVEESSIAFYNSVLQRLEKKRNDFLFSVIPKRLSFGDEESDSSSSSSDISVSLNKPRRKSSKGYSFLESLSSNIPLTQAHPKAQAYKANFKKTKEQLAKVLFTLFNTEVFENKLPADLNITWNARLWKTAGMCYHRGSPSTGRRRVSRIEFSIKVCSSADRLRDTMIHEMCHAAVWIINQTKDGHGPYWRYWASKAMKRFPELPTIERCHDYEIETKFTYKCENCGYSIGRQSKSLNLATKRCGYCVGRFVLLVNKRKKTSNGQSEKQLTTPRPPSAFALFVKENYSIVKQSNSNLKHAEVMKYLGQKFAALKVPATDNSSH